MSQRLLLKAGALLLGYPDRDRFGAVLRALGEIAETPARQLLERFLESALALPETELEAQYVAVFDFREEFSLYLTFQESGDARDRAPALLALKQELRLGGFACPADELPDYIPLLLEFLAERPEDHDVQELERRLARALAGIAGRLDKDALHLPLLQAILTVLPADVVAAEVPRGDQEDLSLPYPLRYL
jgi:nitrate reductase delta subunit